MASKRMPHGYKNDPALKLTKHGLKLNEEDFCQAYLIDFNASKAARSSGYKSEAGGRLLKRACIRERIFAIRRESGKQFDVTREKLLQELMCVAYSDIRHAEIERDIQLWTDEDASSIASIEYDLIGSIKKIQRYDKLKAIEIINKMLGYNEPEKVENKNINYNSVEMSKADMIRISKELEDLV